jgi:hypothetical protein
LEATVRRILSLLTTTALAAGLVAFAPAVEAERAAPAIGETDLFNLAHVFNHDFKQNNGRVSDTQQGTDLEFFSSDVIVRDAEGVVVGADGVAGNDDDQLFALRDFAVVGDHSDGAGIFDITDPEATYLASYQPCNNPRNDVGVHQLTDADGNVTKTLFGLSREGGAPCQEALSVTQTFGGDTGGGGGISLFDITDPYLPAPVGAIIVGTGGAHNFAFHPTNDLIYVWNGELPGRTSTIQIVDLRTWVTSGDFADIKPMKGPATLGSVHDGEFSPDGSLMYVASENNYEIFDNTIPEAPVRLGSYLPNPGTYAHGYFPTPDGSISITNNESLALGGFFAPNSAVCPGEGLGFYDSTDPANVIGPVGMFIPPVQGSVLPTDGKLDPRACTSHFGRVAPNGQVMTVAWYILGSRVVDFSNPMLPVEVAAATFSRDDDELDEGRGSEAWVTKSYKGPYLYVGDQERGFDVFRWAGPDACEVSPWEDGWELACLDGDERLPVDPASTTQGLSAAARRGIDPSALLGLDPATAQRGRYACRL